MRVLLGTGHFNWLRGERVSDRYGYVNLWKASASEETHPLPKAREHEGEHGKLVAIIKETRESSHIGDVFHGIGPSIPEVGEEIVIGEGILHTYKEPEGWV